MVKQAISLLVAALSLASSGLTCQAAINDRQQLENLVAISQNTAQVEYDNSFCTTDYTGTILATSLANEKEVSEPDFVNIASLCDQNIATATRKARVAREINSRSGMVGRLYIPGVGIDVAVFHSNDSSRNQAICDAADSAVLVSNLFAPGSQVIADHVNQDFRTLHNVTPGMSAYIITADRTINLVCTTAFNGHNTGTTISDLNYNDVTGIADYVCYTCQDCWQNVRVVGFKVV